MGFQGRGKVNLLSRNPQLVIALLSPNASSKPDCAYAVQRKAGTVTPFASEQSVLCSPVCQGIIAKNGHLSRISGKGRRTFSAVKTCWRRHCDSNSHYRFESRNPRRLRNLQAVQHLTRESTSSDWPLCRLRTVHLFVRSLRRTAYDSVAESGHLHALARDRHWVRND